MKDKTILNIITALGLSGLFLLFRKKGALKDWFLIYLCKTLVSTLLDGPVVNKKYVQYPHRYFPKAFDSNIIFLYVLFPLSCVMYNQFTYKMKPLKMILSVFLFSGPMALIENWLEKQTNLVRFRKGWNGYYSFSVFSFTFWLVRGFIGWIRFLDKRQNTNE
ncbi:CBO0543 family protein [Alkalihalophilus lindianensis]|uniref:CBO0543 family protein n=1 Tax=Alkalihalophilus lindianensis TaxID=1630542 RepID=A0ABU3X6D5_9BACI|nr:CBO0543 family protein [Alkalihalophilus lindianensis]MDV2682833.1 CBO0543 family protein [Alkalihalophilus lindianensis]